MSFNYSNEALKKALNKYSYSQNSFYNQKTLKKALNKYAKSQKKSNKNLISFNDVNNVNNLNALRKKCKKGAFYYYKNDKVQIVKIEPPMPNDNDIFVSVRLGNGNIRDTLCSKLKPILATTSVRSKKKKRKGKKLKKRKSRRRR
jgi:hypothetical protein